MAVSLSDKPNDDKPVAKSDKPASTSEEQKSVQQEVEEKRQADVDKVTKKNADVLAAAAASSDAAVHNLLGHRTIAELNGDVDELKRIDEELGELTKQ